MLFAGIVALSLIVPGLVSAASTTISGDVGELLDPDASNGGFYLRYVGDPAPSGYSHAYQWGEPSIVTTSPEAGPVLLSGQLDIAGRVPGDVSMIGLIDLDALEGGNTGFQTGAYIYVFPQTSGNLRIGVTDGNAGGEIVQAFLTIPAADLVGVDTLDVTFTVDGTVDPTTCTNDAADLATADGCMTLTVDGFGTVTDSYGSINAAAGNAIEFANGGVPGWEAFPSGPTGIGFTLEIDPIVVNEPGSKDDCKEGGWEAYGFSNQGQCIRFVNTGQDSRN